MTPTTDDYILDRQIGFILRQVTQRHLALFTEMMSDDLTPTQFSAIVRLREHGSCSQNRLGRLTAMDGATIKGVIDRLTRRGVTETRPDPADARLLIVSLTGAGRALADRAIPCGARISEATLAPLSLPEQGQFLALLDKLR